MSKFSIGAYPPFSAASICKCIVGNSNVCHVSAVVVMWRGELRVQIYSKRVAYVIAG